MFPLIFLNFISNLRIRAAKPSSNFKRSLGWDSISSNNNLLADFSIEPKCLWKSSVMKSFNLGESRHSPDQKQNHYLFKAEACPGLNWYNFLLTID